MTSRNNRRWQSRLARRFRGLLVEQLEDRRMMARDCVGLAPQVVTGSPAFGLSTASPASCLASGQSYLIAGQIHSSSAAGVAVTVNDRAVDAYDAVGDFFSRVTILPGENVFEIAAVDVSGNAISQTLTITGRQVDPAALDLPSLNDVTASFAGVHALTSFSRGDRTLSVAIAAQNEGVYTTDNTLVAAVTHLDDPTVFARQADGQLENGSPFYDLTPYAPQRLAPTTTTAPRAISFYVPRNDAFDYDLAFLARLNQAPAIDSPPNVHGEVGGSYAYDVHATDINGDALTYVLLAAPQGMTIAAETGALRWTPAAADRGTHAVLVQVADPRGATTQQSFSITVNDPPPNRPPLFTSVPIASASVNTDYHYQAKAKDADGDPLTFSVVSGPAGLAIDAGTGLVSWQPTGNQTGTANVVLRVSDNHGGFATQGFAIAIGQAPGNSAPIIISSPVLNFDVPNLPNPSQGNVTPIQIDLDLTAGQSSTQTVSLVLPAVASGNNFADIMLVVDESQSMAGDHDWLEGMIPQLDAALQARGIGPNRYSLVGFGGSGDREPGHPFNLIEQATMSLFGPNSSTALANQTLGPVLPLAAFEVTATTSGPQLLVLSDTTNRLHGYNFHVLTPGVSTTALTLGSVVSGSLDIPSEKDQYTFTVSQPTQVYFDALTNNSGIKWSLAGPSGTLINNVAFTSADARFAQSGPALNLVAGDYALTISGNASVVGAYQFRLSDVASATPLTLGTPVNATLTGNETDLYRFDAIAGERFYFDFLNRSAASGDPFWRLTDPFGNRVFQVEFNSAGDRDTLTLGSSGTYTLFIESGITETATTTYSFNVQPAPLSTTALVIGQTISNDIAVAGQQDRYTFTLAAPAQIAFDSLLSSSLNWTLAGPPGTLVANRPFSSSDSANISNPVLNLPAGSYSLIVDGIAEATGSYSFRLLDLATALSLTPGTPVSGSLSPGNVTNLYQFTATAGERYYFDTQVRTGAPAANWRLIDPLSNVVFSNSFTNTPDVETLVLNLTGVYTLLIEGAAGDTTPGTYTFNVQPVTFAATPLALGSTVSSSIGVAGERDDYTFSLAAGKSLYFDSRSTLNNLTWTLTGPAGIAVNSRTFSLGDLLLSLLPAGDYALTVDLPGDAIGSYAFRLLDLSAATALTPGTPVSGDLTPANETDAYQFNATAGDRFSFDLQARTNGGVSQWRLLDPYGNVLFSKAFNDTTASDVATLTLPTAGQHTLLLEGSLVDTTPGNYTFVVVPQGNIPPTPPPASTPLVLGSAISSSISVASEIDRYSFTLASSSLLYFDSRTNDSRFEWTLTGPSGALVTNRSFTGSDTLSQNPVLSVVPGDYVLSISATGSTTGAYSFKLSNPASSTLLTPGTLVSGDLTPANEADLFQFTAAANDRFYFDLTARTNGGSSNWRLYDPYGNVKFTSAFTSPSTSDVDTIPLAQPGTYWLAIEGNITDTASGTYTFNVQPALGSTAPLTLNSLTSGSLATPGDQDRYTFTLPSATRLYFDAQTNNSSLTWTLTGPAGTLVNSRSFTTGGASEFFAVAGAYTLSIDLPGDLTSNYAFNLWDLAAASAITPGTPVSGQLSPANESDVYQFTAAAGDRYYFDVQTRTNGGFARWRLLDPFGNVLFDNNFSDTTQSDVDLVTIAQPGKYNLLLEGAIADATPGAYMINVQPVTIVTTPLTLDTVVSDAINVTGEQDRYTFNLANRSLLYFDALTNFANLNWTLVGPAGTVVSARSFTSDTSLTVPALNLLPGDYTLTFDATTDKTGAYSFRLSNLAAALPLTPGTPVSGSLTPGNETDLFQFTAAAGDQFYFDVQARTNGGQARWQLIDPYGNSLFNNFFSDTVGSDVEPVPLAQPGTYTLLLEGVITDTGGAYTFNVEPINITTTPLVLGQLVDASIAKAGEQDRYTFTLSSPALLDFDSQTNNSTLVWTLDGPTGRIVAGRGLNASDAPNFANPVLNLPAGEYVVTIDGSGAAVGNYAFRLSELAATPTVTPGTPVSGSLSPANETDIYTFTAAAGERFYFDAVARSGAPSARWKLMDPFGSVLFDSSFTATTTDVDTRQLVNAGRYTLLLEGAIGDTSPGTYTINVQPVSIVPEPLTLGAPVSSTISVAGESDRYTFTLANPAVVYFDSLTNNGNLNWTLSGPTGTLVNARSFADGETNSAPVSLPAGDYTLTIDASLDTTSTYAFRLSDLASATPIAPGNPVSGSFAVAIESDLYSFTAASGDRFYFDQRGRTGSGARWRLIDPANNVLFNSSFDGPANDIDTLTITIPGQYTVLVEGVLNASGPGTYTFNVQPVTIATQPLALGSVVSGAISVAGEQDRYTFTLATDSLLYFDSLTNNVNVTWTLAGPTGTPVSSRNFNAVEASFPVLNLVHGDYTLTIDGGGDTTPAYSFRLSDFSSATPLTPDAAVSGSLNPANETDLYAFTAAANDQFSFDVQARTNGGSSVWRLIDPYSNAIFSTSFSTTSSDVGTTMLAQPGRYVLVLEGSPADTAPGDYTFNVINQGPGTPPVPPASTPLLLGSTVSSSIAVAGELDHYTFTLASPSQLYFDSFVNVSNLTWTLIGPAGTAVSNRQIGSSDAPNGPANPIISVPAGDYRLTISGAGSTGNYSFRLLDLASAAPLTPGTPVASTLDPANETDLYHFNASAGDRFYFDSIARGNPGNARWKLIDAYGNALFSNFFTGGDVDTITLPQTGTYTLLLEGGIGDTGIGTYTVNAQPSSFAPTPLVLNSVTSAAISVAGEQDRYTFTLPSATFLYFDVQTNNAQLLWSLVGPAGTVINNRNFTSSDSVNVGGNPVISVPAGDYTLTVDANAESTGVYAFRLSTLSSAAPLTPGTPVSGTLNPANETDLYRFSAAAGERFYFDTQSLSGVQSGRWRLVDPAGNLQFTSFFEGAGSDVDVLTLPLTGVYTLLLEGHPVNTGVGNYTINVKPVAFSDLNLALGEPIKSALTIPGEQHDYRFAGAVGQRLFFDGLPSASTNLTAKLFDPSGNQVFSSPVGTNFGPFYLPSTGVYRLNIDGSSDVIGAYGFELHDVGTAPTPVAGDISGVLTEQLGSDLFLINAAAGQTLIFSPGKELFVGTAAEISRAAQSLTDIGTFEDGYHGMQTGLNLDLFRDGAAANVLLVTDEDRDVLDANLNFTNTLTALQNAGALVNGVLDAQFKNGANQAALGVDSHGNAYIADGAGGFTTTTGGVFSGTVRAGQTTKADYIDLAWALGGAAWDVNLLRGGGLPATSFTKAFVAIKTQEIQDQLALKVIASNPSAGFQNLTGSLNGLGAGATANFQTKITSDGTPQSFDLLFVREGSNLVLGSIPVTINVGDYAYPAQAIDADGDPITFSLLVSPPGATIDPTTGRITWAPPSAGVYHFVIQADDGRGGRGTQAYDLTVTSGAPNQPPTIDGRGGSATQSFTLTVIADTANRKPQIISTPSVTTLADELYRYEVKATDADNDALTFDLLVAPAGMAIDPQSGVIVWRATKAQIGQEDVILRVRDGRGGVDLQRFEINVGALGSAPKILPPVPTAPGIVNLPYRFRFQAQDADGDELTFLLTTAPAGMSIDPASGLLSWQPALGQIGTHAVTLEVVDSRGLRDSLSFNLAVVADAINHTPVINSTPRTSISLGHTYRYEVVAADPDNDRLQFKLIGAPAGMTIDANGLVLWTPTAAQLGDIPIQIQVGDGRGLFAHQNYTLDVVAVAENEPPAITSTPPTAATVGRLYSYPLQGEDPENDPLAWTLDAAPAGMSLNPKRGVLLWTPTENQVGSAEVTVRLYDALGAFTTQSFSILVRATNLSPLIVSDPPTNGAIGAAYVYAVRAEDPEGDVLHYSLTTRPTGMTIDDRTGLIRWTPSGAQLGVENVVVLVSDGQGGSTSQVFTVVVAPAPPNQPPAITSRPVFDATINQPYEYDVVASDPDGDTLVYALKSFPPGMSIDSATGVITWTPSAADVGLHIVGMSATDPTGNLSAQFYTLFVRQANQPPAIDSGPPLTADAGAIYRYDVHASDPDDRTLAYRLTAAPAGMTIDALGRISWVTGLTDVGAHPVTVVVSDPIGANDSQSFSITVSGDTEAPEATVDVSQSPARLGTELIIFVAATDNVGVTDLALTINGAPLAYDSDGLATFRATQTGAFELKAIAKDAAGNIGSAITTLIVIDPTDVTAPSVAIESPDDGDVVRGAVDIVGTASHANLLAYTLALAPLGGDDFFEFARGTTSVVSGVLGRLDPTLLENGTYVLRLTATSASGSVATTEQLIEVASDLKLGNFQLSFTDLTVPVLGVPISVTRTYDTLTAQRSGDFGFGWRLDFRDMNLRTSVARNLYEEYGIYNPFKVGSRVYVTLPGGTRQAFTFQPAVASGFRGGFLGIFEPRFVPDPGVKSSLTVKAADLRISADGRVFDYATGQPYNPTSALFGSSFLLTTKDGIAFDIDGRTGQLTALSDPNNNTLRFSDDGILGPEGKSIRFERDFTGRITAVIDPAGQRIRYEYNARGELISVYDRTSAQTQFAYLTAPSHYLEKVTDPLGRTGTRTEYDASGRLSKLFDADGNPVAIAIDPDHYIATVTDEHGNKLIEEYDERGNVVRQVNALGGIVLRTFDADNNQLTETDQLLRTTTFTYNDRGDVLAKTDPLGNQSLSTFETFTFGTTALAATRGDAAAPFTRLRSYTDAQGNTQQFTYDGSGNITSTTEANGAVTVVGYDRPKLPPISLTDAAGKTTQFETLNRLLMRKVDALGNVTTYTYDANGNPLTSSTTLTAADGTVRTLTTATTYDAEGRLLSEQDAEGATTHYEYDAAGNRTAKIDALGRRTEYRYDARNALIEMIYPDATPNDLADNPRTKIQHDSAGHESARIDELGRRTEFRYDAAGRLTKIIFPDATPGDLADNPFTATEYDAAGQITAQIDERGNRTEYEYDDAGRRILMRDALGHVARIGYDAAGREVSRTDELGHTTRYVYDARGLQIGTQYADGTKISDTYNVLRQRTAHADEENAATHYEYDAAGRLTAVVDPLGKRTEYTLDEAGNVIKAKDANGHVTTFAYDGVGRNVGMTLPLEQEWVTVYDAVGNVVSTTDANGQTIVYAYDARDRLVTKTLPGNSVVSFTYTLTGQRASVTDARGTTNYSYDERDRLIGQTEPDGTEIHYAYDAAGNRTAVTTPAGTTSYTFDALNRLKTVTDSDNRITTYTYDAAGNLIETDFPSGISETRQYDVRNRLTLLEQTGAAGIAGSYHYTLSPAGRRLSVEELAGRRVDYTYDAAGRLTREQIVDAVLGDKTVDYTYDAVGNRLSRDDSTDGVTAYTYDLNDRLLTETLAGDETAYTYDQNGNLLSRISVTDEIFNTWDAENRLIETKHGASSVQHRYNADGLRVATITGGEETRYLVDANRAISQVLLEYRPSGLIVASYVYGRQLISQTRDAVPSFYLADGLGSVRALASLAGQITDRYQYDAFGAQIFSQGDTVNNYRFLGEQNDPFSGLIYLRARHLEPLTGRFVSRDSFPGVWSDPLTLHRYVYAAGDPLNRFDPSGQFYLVIDIELSFSLANILRGIGAVAGGIIGYDEGGLPGMVIGALSGAFLLGRLALVGATEGAPAAAQQVVMRVVSSSSSYARAGGVSKVSGPALGRQFSFAVVPVPVFVQIFREAGEKPEGNETLRVLREQIDNLARNASDPYTAEFYQTLAASLRAADPSTPDPNAV